MGERKGTKGLELWCRRMTEGYPGVNVVNMTTSWRDGLAFCAMIHHFRPDLIEFSKLNKDDVYHNNELAFRVAERHLGIPALLEPEDMVEFAVPDRLSILTYLSQFYQAFVVAQGKSPARIASKRPATSPEHGLVSPASTSPPTKAAFPSAGKVRREPCAKCGHPVFIAERLNVGKLLYHRTCFRCARCNSQLTLANYYETENNDFCCETCPDEEKSSVFNPPDSSVLTRSLSDEEKSASLKKSEESDEYSAKFESALEYPKDDSLKRDSTLTNSQYTRARSFFMSSQVGEANSDSGNEDEPPDLPQTAPPVRDDSFSDSGFPSNKQKTDAVVQSSVSLSQTSPKLEKSHDIVTKDAISAEGNANSLVKARMRLFETKSDAPNETNSVNNKVPSRISTSANNVQVGNSQDLHSFKDNTLNKDPVKSVLGGNDDQTIEEVSTRLDDSVITISDDNEIADTKTTDPSIITISDTTEKSIGEDIDVETIDDTPSIVTRDEPKSDTPEDENEESKKQEAETVETAPIKKEPEDFSLIEQNNVDVAEPPEVRPSEPPEVKPPEPPEVKPPEPPEVKISEPPEVKTSERPEVKTSERPKAKTSERPKVKTSERREVKTSERREVKTSERAEVKPSERAEVKPPEWAEVKPSERPEVKTSEPIEVTPSVASPKETIQIGDEEYPDDLNPFGDEDDRTEEKSSKADRSASLNPFEDEEDDVPAAPTPKPASRKKITPSAADKDISRIYIERISVNPFEEDEESEAPQPAKRKVLITPPKISLNPFWSDDEENDQDKPVPKPRFSKTGGPEARPRESGLSINSSTTFSSSSSLTSSQSGGYTLRKKKPAPKPPSMLSGTESGPSSLTSSPCHSVVSFLPTSEACIQRIVSDPLPQSHTQDKKNKESATTALFDAAARIVHSSRYRCGSWGGIRKGEVREG
jgi:hypothetical protein